MVVYYGIDWKNHIDKIYSRKKTFIKCMIKEKKNGNS